MATCARVWDVEMETLSPCPGLACPVGLTGGEISVHGPSQRKTQDSQSIGERKKKSLPVKSVRRTGWPNVAQQGLRGNHDRTPSALGLSHYFTQDMT